MTLVTTRRYFLAALAPVAAKTPAQEASAYRVDVTIRPRPQWEDDEFLVVVAVRDTASNARLADLELTLDKGETRKSTRDLPIGQLMVIVEIDSRSASYEITIQKGQQSVYEHRASIQLAR